MSNSTIALCIPAYNAETFLGRLLESAQNQTVPFDEIWVYDDVSTDKTIELANSFGVNVVAGSINQGCSHGKNELAQRCKSTWLHFHDADDALESNFVECAKSWMSRTSPPDIVFFAYKTLDHDDGSYLGSRSFNAEALRRDALGYCLSEQINPFCGIYRREAFLKAGGWDEDRQVLQSEDQAGHLRMALAGLSFDADARSTVINYVRGGSMTTSNIPGAQRSTFHVLRKASETVNDPEYRQIIARRLWQTAGLSGAYNDWENAVRAARLAQKVGGDMPIPGGIVFRCLAMASPTLALRVRERLVRLFRPSQRKWKVYHEKPKIRPGS